MHDLTLEFKNKSKTQARQCKNYPKNYHKLFRIIRSHDKNITLSNLQKHALNKSKVA